MSTPIYVFDAYGTLFDVHSAAARFSDEIGPKAGRLSEIWRLKQLEYTWIRAAAGLDGSFRAMTEQGLDYAIAATGGVAPGLRQKLLSAYDTLAAFPEVPDMLARLKAGGALTAILSNGDPDMLASAVSSAGLDGRFDAVLSVAEAGVFKPAMRVYALVTDRFRCAPEGVSFQSSNRWDIAGAKAFGFRTVWVNRAGAPDEYPDLAPDRVLKDLSTLNEA
jgi:2-haloacid dehalogenase